MLTGPEIVTLYKMAKDKDEQIFILAELTASDADTIIEVLKDFGEYKEMNIQRCVRIVREKRGRREDL